MNRTTCEHFIPTELPCEQCAKSLQSTRKLQALKSLKPLGFGTATWVLKMPEGHTLCFSSKSAGIAYIVANLKD